MKCQVCQYDLPPGSTFCTNCGTPVAAPGGSSPNQGIAPTMLASTPQPSNPYGAPAQDFTPPPSAYGAPSNPYGVPETPLNPYGAPPASPYGAPQASPYGTPGAPGYVPGAPGAFGQPVYGQPPKKKGPNGCVIAIIIVASLFVLIVGGIIAAVALTANRIQGAVNNFNATVTTTLNSSVPNASQVNPAASANLSNAQTSNAVDSNYKPTNPTTSFSTSDTIYITYDLAGNAGYVIEKTYDNSDGTIVIKTQTPHQLDSGDTNGYISFSIDSAGSYTTGLYWCSKSDCSDAALAAVVTFSVA